MPTQSGEEEALLEQHTFKKIDAAKFASETANTRARIGASTASKPVAGSLTAEFNSRYSRNQEEKRGAAAGAPLNPNSQNL